MKKYAAIKKPGASDGAWFSFSYDNNGNLIEKSRHNGYDMQYHYDALNRVDEICCCGKQIAQFQYDPVGNIVSVKNPFGNSKTYTYSAANQLTRIDDGNGNLTNYDYDGLGAIQSISQSGYRANGLDAGIFCQNQNQTVFKRNNNGQIISITDALGNTENYKYDELGRLLQKTDREGYETSYEYGTSGKIKKIVYGSQQSVEYTYDHQRKLVKYEDWDGGVTIERYHNGRIKSVTDQRKNKVSYEYEKCGKKKAVIYPDGSRVDYRYNKNLQLTQVSMGGAVDYEYNSHGKLTKKSLPNGVVSTYKYNEDGFLAHFIHEDNGKIIDEYKYSYDVLGRKICTRKWSSGLAKENGVYDYQYDTLGRLAGVKKDGVLLREYAYDSFDNRASLKGRDGEVCYFYNTANQLVREVSKTVKEYSYDKRGNLISVREDGKNTYSYVFNAENRMERAENMNGKFAVYGYNGVGMRSLKETGCITDKGIEMNSREDYVLDYTKGYHNILETDEKGVRQKYVWDDGLLGFVEGGRYRYNLTDDLGSTIRVMSSNGNTLNLYHYDEYGAITYDKGNEETKFQYTGYTNDKISGTYFAEAREYIPAIGRFISEDIEKGKMLHPNTLNHYNYCWGNPVTMVDLNGRAPTFSQKEANEAIWNYYTEKVEDAWDSAVESAGEAWDVAVDSCKGGWNDFMDLQIGYNETRIDLVEKLTGAKTVNVSGAGRVTMGASVSGAAGFTFDSAGNIAFQLTLNGGGGLPGMGYGLSVTGSNAPLFEDYAGMAGVVGGSFAPGINLGYDQIIMENGYLGSSLSVGPGINLPFTAFLEMHGEFGNTWTPFDFNIYEFYNGLKFKDANNCPY